MRRAERIANEILSSDRFAQTKAFKDRVYEDEPILRAGMRGLGSEKQQRPEPASQTAQSQASPQRATQPAPQPTPQPMPPISSHQQPQSAYVREQSYAAQQLTMPLQVKEETPSMYERMHALRQKRNAWQYTYTAAGDRLFFEQARFMEKFEDNYQGRSYFNRYYPTYEDMSDHDLRCYFTWRTRYRKWLLTKEDEVPEAPVSFVFVHAYELLCGIGTTPGLAGYAALGELQQAYEGVSAPFDMYIFRWMRDYVIYHNLDSSLLTPIPESGFFTAVHALRQAENALLTLDYRKKGFSWPDASVEGLPKNEELLDALIALSRYRADRSRFFKDNREDVAIVCCRVFARMVAHCAMRRKKGLIDGYFGEPCRRTYTIYSAAVFWSDHSHEDAVYDCGKNGRYLCEHGFWWHEEPCRRVDKNAELGNLLHTIDARMRQRSGDKHALKERKLPKYQEKFVSEEVEAFYAQREAEEAARVHINRSALAHIRSAAAVTREALLTDDERADDLTPAFTEAPTSPQAFVDKPAPAEQPTLLDALAAQEPTPAAPAPEPAAPAPAASSIPGLTAEQCDVLRALVEGRPLPSDNGLFLSLAVDTINECFLDIVGDTVIEFDGDTPVLVEDYEQEVREALA
ncbi:MAG: TerB N-terminal domain-containing protein [Coriobacteriales bacterium]|nr:TerB N-terminal domain-containing protein [Coriobacteriales bacterium]